MNPSKIFSLLCSEKNKVILPLKIKTTIVFLKHSNTFLNQFLKLSYLVIKGNKTTDVDRVPTAAIYALFISSFLFILNI